MARRRSARNDPQRDAFDIASLAAEVSRTPWPTLSPLPLERTQHVLREIDDRRTFHPERKYRAALTVSGTSAEARRVPPGKTSRSLGQSVGFSSARDVVLCARRKSRREVIFAKRKQRRGAASRRRRRNWWSDIRC